MGGLLRQRRVAVVRHRQWRVHAACRRPCRGMIGRRGAAGSRVCGAHASQSCRGVFLGGVGRAAASGAAGALGRGQRRGVDAGEGLGFGDNRRAVGTADGVAQGSAGRGHTGGVSWRVGARRH